MSRSRLPRVRFWAVATPVSLAVVGAMFVAPTQAAPLPATYSAKALGDLWHVSTLDLDMSGDPVLTDIGVNRVDGLVGSTSTIRSHAEADNVSGTSANGQAVRRGAVSNAANGSDTTAPVAGTAPAGVLSGSVDLDTANLSARGRWVGDATCLAATDRLTDSRASTTGANLVATAIPGEDPLVTIPIVDVPVDPEDGALPLPDPGLPPIDLPGLPTSTALPTETPTSGLPTIEPTLPTSELPTTILPTLSSLPRAVAPSASGPVEMMTVRAAALEQHTLLEPVGADPDLRAVRSEVIGTMVDPSQPAATFFGGEIAVRVASAPKLVAVADGSTPAKVTWVPAAMTLLVAGQSSPITIPADGTPISTNYSGNRQVVLKVSAGQLTDKVEHASGLEASGKASALKVEITNGDDVVLRSALFPMTVSSKAPAGGIECSADSDGDGLSDALEAEIGTDPQDVDTDDDRLRDGREHLKLHTDPLRKDTDRDRLPDGKEVKKFRTKPLKPDTDRDGLKDGREVKKVGTNPRKKDTDGDGVSDGREVKRGTNPLKPD